MNSSLMNALLIVGVMILGTVLTRFLPFLIFPAGKKTPEFVEYLGKTLPFATMGLLVVYCLKGSSLLSIGVGTVFYMVLVQVIFTA